MAWRNEKGQWKKGVSGNPNGAPTENEKIEKKLKIVPERNQLGQWKPGVSGNPNGAPKKGKKGERITDIIKRQEQLILQTFDSEDGEISMNLLEIGILKIMIKASKGNITAMNWIAKYRDGLPMRKVEFTGEMLWGDLMKSQELEKATEAPKGEENGKEKK